METTREMRNEQQGAALITVILILLVLTVLGITAALLMTQEDRTSARQDHLRAALYVAEAGLRQGEVSLQTLRGDRISEALQMTSSAPQNWRANPADPFQHPVYMQAETWDVEHLGTYARLAYDIGGSPELANREVALALDTRATGPSMRAFYSLYVRNNPDDESGTITADADSILRLVSVGWVANVDGRVLAAKIIEEEFDLRAEFVARGTQEGQNMGGTNQAVL